MVIYRGVCVCVSVCVCVRVCPLLVSYLLTTAQPYMKADLCNMHLTLQSRGQQRGSFVCFPRFYASNFGLRGQRCKHESLSLNDEVTHHWLE